MRAFWTLFVAALLSFAPTTKAGQILVVNSSAALQQAINTASDGDIVEIGAGTYAPPSGGFTLYNRPKSFTVRAAQGASVTLTGNGTTDILRLANGNAADKRLITFEHLTFSNGLTTQDFIGGGITLVRVEAAFVGCAFQNNTGNASISGGGAQWVDSSSVSFQSCTWTNNTSPNYGGGISSLNSEIFLQDCRFTGNRVNVTNHNAGSPGGAIFATDSKLQVNSCRFENNAAGYVGGAIYLYGSWTNPVSTPASELTVRDSLFAGNVASRDPSVPFGSPASGGAVHVEDQTTGKFFNCRFNDNVAREGGAISSYRALTLIDGCVFQGNQATGSGGAEGIGGAIFAISSDLPDASTVNGTVNRRPVQLDIRDSIFRGKADGSADARQGGSIFVNGDENAAYGLNGVRQNGTPASNRGIVNLTRVAFADSLAANSGGILGTGGAIMGHFITLNINSSIFQNCVATDYGGALEAIGGSSVLMTNTTVSSCKAGSLGGAITMFGGTLNITQSNFVQNQITGSGNGSVLTTAPAPASATIPAEYISGTISNCVFSNNSGGATIFDGDRDTPPYNVLQYSGNAIFSANGSAAYDGDYVSASTVAQLNQLVMHRSDGTTTIKAPLPANVVPTAAPRVAALLMIPPTVLQRGAPGEALPIPSHLVYSSVGGTALLDGTAQASSSGIVPTVVNGVHTLAVGSTSVSTVPPPSLALNISTRLPVGTDQSVLIGGFIIQGPIPKTVIIRAIGPSLPLAGALQDPFLELHDGTGAQIAANDNWRSTQVGGLLTSGQSVDIQASLVAPSNDAESAIIATLDPGAYTAVVRGANNTTGIAVVEGYDLDADRSSKLANISTRGFVQTGDNVMIGGFILGDGTGASNVVIRGIGPSLNAFGITNPLLDPMLELHDANGAIIDTNDDWRTNQALIQPTGLQPAHDAESALLLTNPALGAYTAILRGKNGGMGVGVVEVYVF